ncbi:MAG: MNIO family bufferin maturase [Rhodospirillales bacterium]
MSRFSTRPAGVGLRAAHHDAAAASRPSVGFYEIHAENYMGGGAQRRTLERLRRDYPLSIHGVGLSLGSAEGIDKSHLGRICELIAALDPWLVSEHLAWSVNGGVYHNDLLPLPYTEEALDALAANVARMQDGIGRRVLIENPSTYLRYAHSPIPEPEFLAALTRRTGAGVLLDVNNIHVSAVNHGFGAAWAEAYIAAIPHEEVGEIHLAGHHRTVEDGVEILIDDHGSPVADAVIALYARAVRRFPDAPTLVEWDSNIPAFDVLVAEARRADRARFSALNENADAQAA